MATRRLQAQYLAARDRLEQRFAAAVAKLGIEAASEAAMLARRFGIYRKRRAASDYADLAGHLLSHYPSEVAYFIAIEISEQFTQKLGYPPIGQIMKALEESPSESGARWIGCALRNFPQPETAQLAFGVIRSTAMRSLVRADLAAENTELAEYICAGQTTVPSSSSAKPETARVAEAHSSPSEGIVHMPRRLTESERRGDRLYLHLQTISHVVLPLFPILGGILGGWTGAVIGLAAGCGTRAWIRRSMGLRGPNLDEGFFTRMRERANGSRRGLLEILIEEVRQRPFTRAQCVALVHAWDQACRDLANAQSEAERRVLIDKLDADVKRISYGNGI